MLSAQAAYDFAARPKVVPAKQKFRDPYSGKEMYHFPSALTKNHTPITASMHRQTLCTIEEWFVEAQSPRS